MLNSSSQISTITDASIINIEKNIKVLKSYTKDLQEFKSFIDVINKGDYPLKLDFSTKYPMVIAKFKITKELKAINLIFKKYKTNIKFNGYEKYIRLCVDRENKNKNIFYIFGCTGSSRLYENINYEYYKPLMLGILDYLGIKEKEMELLKTISKTDKNLNKVMNLHKTRLKKVHDLYKLVNFVNTHNYSIKIDFSNTFNPVIVTNSSIDINNLNNIFEKTIINNKHLYIISQGRLRTKDPNSNHNCKVSPLYYKHFISGVCEYLNIDFDKLPEV